MFCHPSHRRTKQPRRNIEIQKELRTGKSPENDCTPVLKIVKQSTMRENLKLKKKFHIDKSPEKGCLVILPVVEQSTPREYLKFKKNLLTLGNGFSVSTSDRNTGL